MGKLSNKVAVVTGASKGIGAGIAERLAADGAKVVVNYSRSVAEAEALVAKIKAAGGEAVAVRADIADPAQIQALFDKTLDAFGTVDILVNNAGLYIFGGLDSATPELIDKHYNLNVKGLILATQAAARVFPKEGGVVVNISSGVAKTPMVQAQVYSSTKGAVDVLTRGLAVELGPRNIRVVGIAPGLTSTEGTSGMDQPTKDQFIGRTPLGRLGVPADIAAAVAFVASEDGAWITGETLQVGGGLTL
ncbi:SDR family NAD(P)-dependent oxidoreductase [Beijerinckia sp. L45]|uniref:SDR family NAD(P)-dependent oxidoreductase n=1 Tax=Beijerinckia sp. L45 TaxID=1641855 RepID=UPI001576E0E2|nr:glucose 1-dehydrogenase [Beijerinckia sp. L45]